MSIMFFISHDAFLYKKPILSVTHISEKKLYQSTSNDSRRDYKENRYRQYVTGIILNGDYKGKTAKIEHDFSESEVYDLRYSKGDKLFLDNTHYADYKSNIISANVSGEKRDSHVFLPLIIMSFSLIMLSGTAGLLTILSLIINLLCFYFAIGLYLKGINILALMAPTCIFITAMLLFFLYGNNPKTHLAFFSSIVSSTIVVVLSSIVLFFSGDIDYDFLDFLQQPYKQTDATFIFISEILVCSLGAIMDVVVTMTETASEIFRNKAKVPNSERTTKSHLDYVECTRELDASLLVSKGKSKNYIIKRLCRNVGDEVVGTMISIMFFTNIASGLPFFILAMRNGIRISTILHYHMFFEIARFLTGSIGIVISIPIAAFIAVNHYARKENKKC